MMQPSPLFEQLWFNLTGRFKLASDDVMNQKWYRALLAIYDDEQHRIVHDTSWIVDTMWRIDEYAWNLGAVFEATEAMELAAWFRYSVFSPLKDEFTNTLSSAQMAGECMSTLKLGDEIFRRKVVRLITSPAAAAAEFPEDYSILNDVINEWYTWSDEDHARRLHLLKEEWQEVGAHAFVDWRRNQLNKLKRRGYVMMTKRGLRQEVLAMERVNLELSIYDRVMPPVNA